MTTACCDNGILVYIDGQYVAYFPYSVWSIAKRACLQTGRRVFDVLLDIFYKGGCAGAYIAELEEARDVVGRELGKLNDHGNPYQPDPVGVNRPHPGRLGTVWALYDPLCTLASRCSKHPNYEIYAEQMTEYEC